MPRILGSAICTPHAVVGLSGHILAEDRSPVQRLETPSPAGRWHDFAAVQSCARSPGVDLSCVGAFCWTVARGSRPAVAGCARMTNTRTYQFVRSTDAWLSG